MLPFSGSPLHISFNGCVMPCSEHRRSGIKAHPTRGSVRAFKERLDRVANSHQSGLSMAQEGKKHGLDFDEVENNDNISQVDVHIKCTGLGLSLCVAVKHMASKRAPWNVVQVKLRDNVAAIC